MRAKVLVLLCKWRVPWRGRRPARQGLAAPRGGAVTRGGGGAGFADNGRSILCPAAAQAEKEPGLATGP